MTTQEPDEPCQPTHGIRHYAARTNGVNLLSSRLPTRLANAIDAHAGYLDEVTFGICHAVLIELGNWELIAKGSTSPSSTRRATSLQDAQLVDRRATDPSRQKHLYSTAGEHGTTHKLPERQDFPTRTEVDRLPRLLKMGEQYCAECSTFMSKVGIGGLCPSCGEAVSITELGHEVTQ